MSKYLILFVPLWCFFSFHVLAQDTLFKPSVHEILKNPVRNSMENLLNTEVVTVSNVAEKISEAPASTIVITRQQILDRGYNNLMDIFQDLPDIDLTMPYADVFQYKAYWRGNRSDLGSFFLFMLDGVIYNNLYFNEGAVLAALPISSIEKIEVVYGPASATYGANAFMGVINIITQSKDNKEGISIKSRLGSTHTGMTWADISSIFKNKKLKINLNARFQQGNVNQLVNADDFYWLRNEHYANNRIWGALSNNPAFVGKQFSSPLNNRAIDARIFYDKLEVGLQHFVTHSGFGMMYPADKLASNGKWEQPENTAFVRYTLPLTSKFSSQTLLRYRQSYLSNDSYDIEGYDITNNNSTPKVIGNTELAPNETARVLQYIYYSTYNTSWSLFQNFEWRINEKFTLYTGVKYEAKNLQKAYELTYSDFFVPSLLTNPTDILPKSLPNQYSTDPNRTTWEDRGLYGQLKWQINPNNIFNLGYRYDHNSAYGAAPTLRGSFVKKYKKLIFKAFYGEAFQEPALRVLYSNWTGSGADPNLRPETSRTFEIATNFTNNYFSHDVSAYVFDTNNSIIGLQGGAKNLGKRQVWGASYRLQGQVKLFRQTYYWLNYSVIFNQVEQKFSSTGEATEKGIIGDLAPHKIQAGVTSHLNNRWAVSFSGRWIAAKQTIDNNPIREVDAYFVADMNVNFKLYKALLFNLRINNILDTQYFHTGVRTANGGNTAGIWQDRYFVGSSGFFNSLLPQPRRLVSLNVVVDF